MTTKAIHCATKGCDNSVKGRDNYHCTSCSRARYYPIWHRNFAHLLTNMAGYGMINIGEDNHEITSE